MTKHLAALLLIVLLPFAAHCGCRRASAEQTEKKPAPKLPVVMVAAPTEETVTEYEQFTGRTTAVYTVEIRARVSGYLDRVLFREGLDVKEGAPLFEIDPRTYQAEVDRASSAVDQSAARLERLTRHEERVKRLWQSKTITDEEFDQARFDRAEAAAMYEAAKASLETAQLNLSFTKIASPITGRISRRLVDPGNLVRADETPLANIVSVDPIYAYFDIDERTALRLRRLILDGKLPGVQEGKMNVQLALADEDQFLVTGTIDFFDNQIEAGTGTLRLRAVIRNERGLLSPGLFVRVRIPIGVPHAALLVREESLGTDQGQRFIYVVDEQNQIDYRRVKVGFLSDGKRVIESGLKPGERVVVTGLQRVRPGAKVEPKSFVDSDGLIAAPNAPDGQSAPAVRK